MPVDARTVAWTQEVLAASGESAGSVVTPDLAPHAPPLTRHFTSVAPAPGRKFVAACLCGWTGARRTRAADACADANAHEGDGAM